MSLDNVPDDTAAAVRELDGYDWQSDEGAPDLRLDQAAVAHARSWTRSSPA
ncbi:MAG: hypothetical protein WKF83_05755 [Nocardioidaceae bacterium]